MAKQGKSYKIIYYIFVSFLLTPVLALSASLTVPLKTLKKPASDLIDESGQAIDAGAAATLASQGVDLSFFNPQESRMWQNERYPSEDASHREFPDGAIGVTYDSVESTDPHGILTARAKANSESGTFLRLTISRFSHSVLMRAALLRKLGYFVPSPKFYSRLKVQFQSTEQLEDFLTLAQRDSTNNLETRKWAVDINKQQAHFTLTNALLEENTAEYFDIHHGLAPSPENPKQIPLLQRLSRSRAYRALIIPYTLVDVPESINRFSAKLGSIMGGSMVLTHMKATSFQAAAIEDLRWLTRRLGTLTKNDIDEIVKEGHWPESFVPLITAKLIYRINNLLELADLNQLKTLTAPSLNISSPEGWVKEGKVVVETIEGSPLRFSHGSRISPYNDGDLSRYLMIDFKSSVLGEALARFNEKIQVLDMDPIAITRQENLRNQFIEHLKTNPRAPFDQKVEGFGGPLMGLNFQSSRHVATGTYYDSTAPVQLVDSFSVGSAVGYFYALDGVPKFMPSLGGNLQLVRSYTHVKPITSIKAAADVSWKDLSVPTLMRHLAKVMSTETLEKKEGEEPPVNAFDKFLSELQVGEVFSITDTLVVGVAAQLNSPLNVLFGFEPLSFLNSISLGSDASQIHLKQTSIMKTAQGLQIYVRDQNGKSLGLNFDVNYFIKLLKIRSSMTTTDIHTDAFVIDYDPSRMAFADDSDPQGKKLRELRTDLFNATKSLFRSNDVENLYSNFPYRQFEIDHKLKTQETQTKLLWLKSASFKESHDLVLTYPRNPDFPELNPDDERIHLFSYKMGSLKGRDLLGLGLDFADGVLSKQGAKGGIARNSDPNPANMPFGKSYWKIIKAEADVSPTKKQLPTVASIQHVWGGWSLKRAKFLSLLDQIQSDYKDVGLTPYRLIEKEAFQNVEKVDFYRLTANLAVLPAGVSKIRDLITQPDATTDKSIKTKTFIGKFFGKLRGDKNYRPGDSQLYQDLLSMIGNGDLKKGEQLYLQDCTTEQTNSAGYWVNGTHFDCLTPWMDKLLKKARKFPTDKKQQAKWLTETLAILDEYIPQPILMKYLGEKNYLFALRINGFREGDEDGDLEYFANSFGDPDSDFETAGGLYTYWANKTRLSPIELDRSQGSFR